MPSLRATIPLLIWPAALGGLAFALTHTSGRAIWHPLVASAGEFGLLIGLVHAAVVHRLRRAAARRSPSRLRHDER